MRIAFISDGSPTKVSTWSGTPYHMLTELRRRFGSVTVIDTPTLDSLFAKANTLNRLGFMPAREPLATSLFTHLLEARLRQIRPDVVLAVAAEHKVAGLGAEWPVVVVSDSFFGNMVHYYPQYRHLSARTIALGDRQQRQLIERGWPIMLSSDWAVDTAAEYYGQPVSRFEMVPFGANLMREAPRPPVARPPGPLKLLFVGYDWVRKGGQIVFDAFKRLRSPDAQLHIVGCRPPETIGHPGVVYHGVLDKDDATDAENLDDLFRSASLFFMPSRQEACAVAFAEACAFGLPCVAADTGGVGTIVVDQVTGLMLPLAAGGEEFARIIDDLWEDEARYLAMRAAARAAFETRLNWRAWGDAAEAIMLSTMRKRQAFAHHAANSS
jgi:glycosyltransferase involved in cell wall biosynthesis